jgi:hypothetical protein
MTTTYTVSTISALNSAIETIDSAGAGSGGFQIDISGTIGTGGAGAGIIPNVPGGDQVSWSLGFCSSKPGAAGGPSGRWWLSRQGASDVEAEL